MPQREKLVKSTLDHAMRQFELAEANLVRLENLWGRIEGALPSGPAFGAPAGYEEWRIAFERILEELPAIDGFSVENHVYHYDEVGQLLLDAFEVGDIEVQLDVERALSQQGDELRKYRIQLGIKRRELVRDRLIELIDRVDRVMAASWSEDEGDEERLQTDTSHWLELRESLAEINVLLGSDARPDSWDVLRQQLETEKSGSLADIAERVWPDVSSFLRDGLYGDFDPVPVDAGDLNEVLNAVPTGPVSEKLDWSVLSDEEFERLIFNLLSEADGYENVQWLQKTHAPDKGRDISAERVDVDGLGSVRRHRTIIQCKHWLAKSVGRSVVADSRNAMELWKSPRVDTVVIATSGRFTGDAISMVETHNQSDRALTIEMWPESHLERMLASRPHLVGQFGLRRM